MITGIAGTLEASDNNSVIITVGYFNVQAHVPTTVLDQIGPLGSQVCLVTHLQITDNTLMLYGFLQPQDLRLFQMLLGVNGVGPRAALSLLSTITADEVATAIISEDSNTLSHAPGIGRRTASRIILDLRTKIEQEWVFLSYTTTSMDTEVVAALTSLGYSESEARQALRNLDALTNVGMEERVRQALQQMGNLESR